RVRDAAPAVAGIGWGGHAHLSAVVWRDGLLATSEQSLPRADRYEAVLNGGARQPATLVGRDSTTNVAILRTESTTAVPSTVAPPGVGALVLALGSNGAGGVTARLGGLEVSGPAWDSRAGGRIDALLRVGVRLGPGAEGGPVLDARGSVLGMSTFGPRRTVLVIPAATIERVLEPLLRHGRISRGWLGVGLHPVALPSEMTERAAAGHGLMVVSFADQAPARTALLPGDILLEIGGRAAASPRDVAAALGPETVGQGVLLKVLRGGAVTTETVTVGARPC
ncbi:MAG: serine protease, partial [Acetobacteraceae bacterium]|nr:serine protease [Acetobacteraceae bacterium]